MLANKNNIEGELQRGSVAVLLDGRIEHYEERGVDWDRIQTNTIAGLAAEDEDIIDWEATLEERVD